MSTTVPHCTSTFPQTHRYAQFLEILDEQVQHILAQARHDLRDFNLAELKLSPLALVAFHFLFKAIDLNENKRAGEPADDYLLILPDVELAEEALQGALLGALLGKYRANYIASSREPQSYTVGDILLKPKQNGTYQWFRVDGVDGDGNVTRRVAAYGPQHHKTAYPGPVPNTMRLLSKQQANVFQLGADYPSARIRSNLTQSISQIRRFVPEAQMVSEYPHRMGVVCGSAMKHFVAETYPMPLRDWSTQNKPQMLLPLEPMAETGRTYQYLVENVFWPQNTYNRVEELLVFDVRQYCDGNGKFTNLLQGKQQGYYRNLVLVGSRAPVAQKDSTPHSFCRWKWTPEELMTLQGRTLRYPVVEQVADPTLLALHEAIMAEWTALEKQHGLDLAFLRRALSLFYRLLLPASSDEASGVRIQTLGLRQWVDVQLRQRGIFSSTLVYDPALRQNIVSCLLSAFEKLAVHLSCHNAKAEYIHNLLTPADALAPRRVLVVVSHRDVELAREAFAAAFGSVGQRLEVIDGRHLTEHLRDPALAQPDVLWVLGCLRVGRQLDNELSLYRRLFMSGAEVRILAYVGIETGRYTQLAILHQHLVEQALAHPDRAHFINCLVARPGADSEEPATYTASEASAPQLHEAKHSIFADFDNLFGDPGDGVLAEPTPMSAHKFKRRVRSEDELDSWLPSPQQQCWLYFRDGTRKKVLCSKPLHIALDNEGGLGQCLGRRLPLTLQVGHRVLLLAADSPRLLSYLRGQDPRLFAAIDAAAGCWQNALRRLVRHYGRPASLHVKLKEHGLRLRLSRMQQWLEEDTPVRFPAAKRNLRAIATLERIVYGADAQLPVCLDEVLKQRTAYNTAVSGVSRSYRAWVLHSHVVGTAIPALAVPDTDLLGMLQSCVETQIIDRVELLISAEENQLSYEF